MHYLDNLFHMDSKMYLIISKFFSNYFNNLNNLNTTDNHHDNILNK